jgi:thimet oligopeptidase
MPIRPAAACAFAAVAALVLAGGDAAAAVPSTAPLVLVLDFKLTPAQIDTTCQDKLAAAGKRVDALVHARSARSFATVSEPLENVLADLVDDLAAQTLLYQVALDKDVRDASERCNSALSGFQAALFARPDLYAALAAATRSGSARGAAQKKLLEIQLLTARRSGAGLPEAGRRRFVEIARRITDLENAFANNLSSPQTIALAKDQIDGLPPDLVAGLKTDADGRFIVTVDESNYSQFLASAKSEAARKAYYVAYQTRGGPRNVDLLELAIALRDEQARLLGYPSFSAYTLADRMAGTPGRVAAFLDSLDARLMATARRQRDELAAFAGGGELQPWDRPFWSEQFRQKQFDLDRDAVRQYFPAQHTVDAVLAIYSRMLGLTFTKGDDLPTWQPDVVGYRVTDTASGADRGVFYLDLYPRPGKYHHFANMGPSSRRVLPDGRVRPAVNTIVGNWPAPAPDKPSLLSHADVLVFFHEFGHNVAALCADTPYETLNSGYRQDFVEAPSQMLENFVWDPAILRSISSRVDTGAPLPDALIAKMNAARHYDQAWNEVSFDIFYAQVDQRYHSAKPPVDTTAVWKALTRQITPDPFADGTIPQANFGHLMGGYEASYYAYAWAKVYAQDLFTAFQQGGLLNPEVGLRYRRDILAPARSVEPDGLVKTFLGRPMTPDAFYADLGLATR